MATDRPRRPGRRHHRLRRRRRHPRLRADHAGRHVRRAGGRPVPHAATTTRTTSGRRSARWPGWTCAPRRVAGGWPRTSPTCRPGSSRPSAARPRTGPARPRGSWRTSSRPGPTTATSTARPARLADHPRRAGALLRPGRAGDRLDPPPRPSRAAGQQQLQGVRQRRREDRLQVLRHRPLRHERRALRRPAGHHPGRLQLPGRQERRQVVDRCARDPARAGDRQARPAAGVPGRQDHPRRQRQGRRRRVPRRGRQPAPAGRPGRLRRRQLDRVAAAAADERELAAPRRPGQLLGPGGPQLHAAHDRLGRTRASTGRCGCTAARRWPGSSPTRPSTTPRAASPAATTWRPSRSARPSWPPSSSRGTGAGRSPR